MRTFVCICGNGVYFVNTQCVACRRELGYLPNLVLMASLEPLGGGVFAPAQAEAAHLRLRKCRNYESHDVCNWMIGADDPEPFCESCRLNQVIPNLSVPRNKEYWYRLEREKRRLIYGLRVLGLPVISKKQDPERGLAFAFMSDHPDKNSYLEQIPGEERVLTGHAKGLITINIAEADDVSREWMRVKMEEKYRTLLGHFRHEVGHYYWDRLVRGSEYLAPFERLYGDWRGDYEKALESYYRGGPPGEWKEEYVSPYAAAHPWEDWAETWAHYLHMVATMETAHYHGFLPDAHRLGLDSIGSATPVFSRADFDTLIQTWVKVFIAINGLNLSLGYHLLYPFILTPKTIEKMRLVHTIIERAPAMVKAE